MAGTLFVVATPIGNLEDITLRALRILREVDVVAAEDTRRTRNLLRHFEIGTPLISLHAHNERLRVPAVLAHLRSGRSVALVSDAGTPGISDPGADLVRAVRKAGFEVTPIPGASAIAAAVSAAGLPATGFTFLGFPPTRLKDRTRWLEALRSATTATVLFESPHRVRRTLTDIQRYLGNRPILVARELTKVHEEWRHGTPDELSTQFPDPQGEFVLMVFPPDPAKNHKKPPTDAEVYALFGQTTENKALTRRNAIRSVADELGISVRAVYAAIERARDSGV